MNDPVNATTVIEGSLNINRITAQIQYQYLYPKLRFLCNGTITKWIFGAEKLHILPIESVSELQIWRHTGPDTYTKQSASLVTANETASPNVHEYYPETPLQFQQGDILGVFYSTLSNLQLYVQDGNGPLNVFHNASTPPEVLSASRVEIPTFNYFPLVSPAIGKYTHNIW